MTAPSMGGLGAIPDVLPEASSFVAKENVR